MKIVTAIDSFKGSMTSMEAGQAAAEGIQRVDVDAEVIVRPLADGGEGTVAVSYTHLFPSQVEFCFLERRILLEMERKQMFCRMISISQTCLYLIKLSVEVYLFQGTEN